MTSTTSRTHGTRGFTYLEVAVGSVIVLMILTALSSLLTSTDSLTRETRTQTRAVAEHRRNLRALSNLLRTVEASSVAGIDDATPADITFERVTGIGTDRLMTTGTERLAWRPAPVPVQGIVRPGSLHLITSTGDVLVADRVPEGGFRVEQQGQMLAIRLTTYYHGADTARTAMVTSQTAVALRN